MPKLFLCKKKMGGAEQVGGALPLQIWEGLSKCLVELLPSTSGWSSCKLQKVGRAEQVGGGAPAGLSKWVVHGMVGGTCGAPPF